LPQPRLVHITNTMQNAHTTKGISIIHDKQHKCKREGRMAAAVLKEYKAAERGR